MPAPPPNRDIKGPEVLIYASTKSSGRIVRRILAMQEEIFAGAPLDLDFIGSFYSLHINLWRGF